MILLSSTRWMETVLCWQMFYAILQCCALVELVTLHVNIGYVCSCGSVVEQCVSSAKVVGSIPREHILTIHVQHCKSLWIKASAKCINVNVNNVIDSPVPCPGDERHAGVRRPGQNEHNDDHERDLGQLPLGLYGLLLDERGLPHMTAQLLQISEHTRRCTMDARRLVSMKGIVQHVWDGQLGCWLFIDRQNMDKYLCLQNIVSVMFFHICEPGAQNQSYGSIFLKLRLMHHLKAE